MENRKEEREPGVYLGGDCPISTDSGEKKGGCLLRPVGGVPPRFRGGGGEEACLSFAERKNEFLSLDP